MSVLKKKNVITKINGKWIKLGIVSLFDNGKENISISGTQIKELQRLINEKLIIGKEVHGETYYHFPIFEDKFGDKDNEASQDSNNDSSSNKNDNAPF